MQQQCGCCSWWMMVVVVWLCWYDLVIWWELEPQEQQEATAKVKLFTILLGHEECFPHGITGRYHISLILINFVSPLLWDLPSSTNIICSEHHFSILSATTPVNAHPAPHHQHLHYLHHSYWAHSCHNQEQSPPMMHCLAASLSCIPYYQQTLIVVSHLLVPLLLSFLQLATSSNCCLFAAVSMHHYWQLIFLMICSLLMNKSSSSRSM